MVSKIDFFGVNLGNSALKFAYLKNLDSNNPVIESIFSYSSSSRVSKDLNQKDIEILKKDLIKAYKSSGIKTKNCVLSLSETSIYSRLITLPQVKEEELDEAILWALKPIIPIPVEELNISFLEVESKKLNNVAYTSWYVVAVSKSIINIYQEIFLDLGLNLLAIETESIALCRLEEFVFGGQRHDSIIFDIGSEASTIIISKNGIPVFSQSINTGANTFTKAIASDFSVDMVRAENIKQTIGLDNTNDESLKILNSLTPLLELFANELSKTMIYYKEKIGGSGISQINLTGGGSLLKNIDEYLSQKLKINVKKVDISQKFKLGRKIIDRNTNNLNTFTVPIGLALKGYV